MLATGVFDVSHMGQLGCRAGALAFAQRMLSNDLDRIGRPPSDAVAGRARRPIDDLIATGCRRSPLLVNAAPRDDDFDWLERHLGEDVTLDDRSPQTAMLALQG